MALYKVRWKGRILGEFSREQIQEDLRSAKICQFHQILVGENWMLTKDFLENYVEPPEEEENVSERSINIAYFSTGLAFLSPYLIVICLACAGYLFKNNAKKNALVVALLGVIMMLLGLGFFLFVDSLKN